jgi:hypothetical protein
VVDREGKQSDFEERDNDIAIQNEGIPHIKRKEKENYHQLSPAEGYPLHPNSLTQDRLCVRAIVLEIGSKAQRIMSGIRGFNECFFLPLVL